MSQLGNHPGGSALNTKRQNAAAPNRWENLQKAGEDLEIAIQKWSKTISFKFKSGPKKFGDPDALESSLEAIRTFRSDYIASTKPQQTDEGSSEGLPKQQQSDGDGGSEQGPLKPQQSDVDPSDGGLDQGQPMNEEEKPKDDGGQTTSGEQEAGNDKLEEQKTGGVENPQVDDSTNSNAMASPADDNATAPTDDDATAPTDDTQTPPMDGKLEVPTDDNATAPTDDAGAAPTDDHATAPTDGDGTAPTDEHATASTDGAGAAPTDGDGAAPTDDRGPAASESSKKWGRLIPKRMQPGKSKSKGSGNDKTSEPPKGPQNPPSSDQGGRAAAGLDNQKENQQKISGPDQKGSQQGEPGRKNESMFSGFRQKSKSPKNPNVKAGVPPTGPINPPDNSKPQPHGNQTDDGKLGDEDSKKIAQSGRGNKKSKADEPNSQKGSQQETPPERPGRKRGGAILAVKIPFRKGGSKVQSGDKSQPSADRIEDQCCNTSRDLFIWLSSFTDEALVPPQSSSTSQKNTTEPSHEPQVISNPYRRMCYGLAVLSAIVEGSNEKMDDVIKFFENLSTHFEGLRIVLDLPPKEDDPTEASFVSSFLDFCTAIMGTLTDQIRQCGSSGGGSAIDNALKEYKKALEAVASKLTVKAYKEMTEAYINLAKAPEADTLQTPLDTSFKTMSEAETQNRLNSYIYDYLIRNHLFSAAERLLDDAVLSLDWDVEDPAFDGFPGVEGVITIPGGLLKEWWRVILSFTEDDAKTLDVYIYNYLKWCGFNEAADGLSEDNNEVTNWELSEPENKMLLKWAQASWKPFENCYLTKD